VPSYNDRALEITSVGSTWVRGIWLANEVIAASMVAASLAHTSQQLWNSVPRRTTKRDWAGSSRSIFAWAFEYASTGSLLAKYGCCGVTAEGEWQREQYLVSSG